MTIFDLLFVLVFLGGLVSLVVAAILALRGRQPRARRIVRRLGIVVALYVGALLVVSALSPQRVVAVGEDQCSDDWCISVQWVRRDTTRTDIELTIGFRLSSRAGRISQRERFVAAYLRDDQGHRYDPLVQSNAVPFDTLLAPHQSIMATRRFVVPAHAGPVGLVITREGGGWFPRCCIIAEERSLLHRPAVVRL